MENHPKIFMRTQLYDEKTARVHIKRVEDILSKPCVLNAQQSSPEEDQLNDIMHQGKIDGLSDEDIQKKQEEIYNKFQSK